jgi:hypothetical protein
LHHPSRREHVHNSPPGKGFDNFDQCVERALHFNPGIISKAHYHVGTCTGKKPFAAKLWQAIKRPKRRTAFSAPWKGDRQLGEFTVLEILF